MPLMNNSTKRTKRVAEPEISAKVVEYADVIVGLADVRLSAGSPGRYATLSNPARDIAASRAQGSSKSDVRDSIRVERHVWTRACQTLLAPATRLAVAEAVASGAGGSPRQLDPWYGIAPDVDASVEADIRHRELRAERTLLLCIKAHVASGKYADLEQATRGLGELATARARVIGDIPAEDYPTEASRLTTAFAHVLPSPARRFLIGVVKENFAELAGDPSATVPDDVWDRGKARRRGFVYEWITDGGWDNGGTAPPDPDGVWFTDLLQDEYHEIQVRRQLEIEQAAEAATSPKTATRAKRVEVPTEPDANEQGKKAQAVARAKERKERAAIRKAQAAQEKGAAAEEAARGLEAKRSGESLAARIRAEYDEAVREASERLIVMGVEPTRAVIKAEFNRTGRFRDWAGTMNHMPGFDSVFDSINPHKPSSKATRAVRSAEKVREDLLENIRDGAVARYAKSHGVEVSELSEDLVEKIRRYAN